MPVVPEGERGTQRDVFGDVAGERAVTDDGLGVLVAEAERGEARGHPDGGGDLDGPDRNR